MTSFKQYAYAAIQSNPSRYGVDGGELNLINDYLRDNKIKACVLNDGILQLTIEHHKIIAGVLRKRNEFLQDERNSAYDLRTQKTSYIHVGQTSIYDFMDDEARLQLPKIINYWESDANRYSYSNSRIKKSIRGIDDEHIITARVMLPLLVANPQLKQKRVKKSKIGDTYKAPRDGHLSTVFDGVMETNKTGAEDALRYKS